MRQGVGRLQGSGLRIVVAVTAAFAVATATTVDQTQAQLPKIEVPGVVTVETSPPKLSLTSPTLPSVKVTPPAVTVPATPVTPEVKLTPPSVQTPSITIPKAPPVTIPKTPKVTLPPAPKVEAPTVPSPQLPRVDASPTLPGSRSGAPAERSGSGAVSRPSAPASTGGSGGGPTAAALASLGAPSAATLRTASPARRRALLRQAWDRPLRGKRLRQLRRTISQYQGCLGELPQRGRRVLDLRAGLGPGKPVSRRVVARRLGLSLPRTVRVERSALRQLVGAGERGRCDSAAGALAAAATGFAAAGSPGAPGGTAGDRGDRSRNARERADARDRPDPRTSDRPEYVLDPRGEDSPLETVFFLLLVLLALPLGVLFLAWLLGGGSRAGAGAAPIAPDRRPLLFVSADGLVAVQADAGQKTGTRADASARGPIAAVYASDQARELVRRLAASFELVLIAGWEHDANRARRVALEDRELPVLTARQGSAASKARGVALVARNRPAAWIDEDIDDHHKQWASGRSLPTLLVAADEAALKEDEVVTLLREWADQIAVGEQPEQRLVSQS